MEYTWRKKITGLSSNMGAVNGLWAAHPPAVDHLSGDGVPLVRRRRRRGALSPPIPAEPLISAAVAAAVGPFWGVLTPG